MLGGVPGGERVGWLALLDVEEDGSSGATDGDVVFVIGFEGVLAVDVVVV